MHLTESHMYVFNCITHVFIKGKRKGKVNTTSKEHSYCSLNLIYARLQLNLVFRQVPI